MKWSQGFNSRNMRWVGRLIRQINYQGFFNRVIAFAGLHLLAPSFLLACERTRISAHAENSVCSNKIVCLTFGFID